MEQVMANRNSNLHKEKPPIADTHKLTCSQCIKQLPIHLDLSLVPLTQPLPSGVPSTGAILSAHFTKGVFLIGFEGTFGAPLALQRRYASTSWTSDVHKVPSAFVAFVAFTHVREN